MICAIRNKSRRYFAVLRLLTNDSLVAIYGQSRLLSLWRIDRWPIDRWFSQRVDNILCFCAYHFLWWWAPCRQEMWIFQLSVGVKHPWSRVNGCHLLLSFHRLPCCIHFLAVCFHVLSYSVPMYRRYLSRNADMPKPSHTGQVGIRPKRALFVSFCFIFRYRLAIVLEACAGCHLQASWTCTC